MDTKSHIPENWNPLDATFYQRDDVVTIAKELIGKILVTTFDNIISAGRIVETEAYNGVVDKASHAYNDRRTKRTEIMYANGGHAYVYLCYGIHHLFNVVTNINGIPNAVLIRALEPILGIATMLERSKKSKQGYDLTRGPGNVSKSLGITTRHTGVNLIDGPIIIFDDEHKYKPDEIVATTRIGVDYAGADALLPYRFIVKGNLNVSRSTKSIQTEIL